MSRKYVLILLMLCAVLLSGCTGNPDTKPSLDVSSIPDVSLTDSAGSFTIDGVAYMPYCSATALCFSEDYHYTIPADFALGEILGYYATESLYHYIVSFSPADSAEWLLVFSDDGEGNLDLSQAEEFYRATTVTEVPTYIEDANRCYQEAIAPGSYEGPYDGLTVASDQLKHTAECSKIFSASGCFASYCFSPASFSTSCTATLGVRLPC